ncbi:MAG: carbohydrate kinase family protein [Promethearchaeota archaeon]
MNEIEIVGLGEIVVDWVMQIPHFPKPDEKIDALSENIFPGGVTANFLVAASRLGGKCGFIGAIGDDEYGNFLVKDLKDESIDTTLTLKKPGMKTPINFIFVVKGEKTIIQSPHMQTTKLDISDLDDSYIARARVLHTTMIHLDLTKKAFKIAKENDVKISIDLESQIASKGWQSLKNYLLQADVLIPNKEGAKSITKTTSPETAARILVKKGIPIVIITLGEKGALITTKKYQKRIPAFHVKNVVDTTGAGDTFNGAFTVAYWLKNWDVEKACLFANAAASLKVQKLGARVGIPSEQELERFLKKHYDDFFS